MLISIETDESESEIMEEKNRVVKRKNAMAQTLVVEDVQEQRENCIHEFVGVSILI